MKVLMVHSLYYPDEHGGAEVAVRMVSEELSRRGISVVVASLSPGGGWKRDRIHGVTSIQVPLANVYWPFGRKTPGSRPRRLAWHLADAWNPVMSRRLGKVLDAEQPDIVNLHNLSGFSASAINCVTRRRIPVVATLHDYYFVCCTTTMFRGDANCERQCRACRFLTVARRRASSRVTTVVGVSQAVLTQVQRHGAFRGVPAIVNMNASRPAICGPRRPGGRRDHKPGDPLHVGFLGRLIPTKGVDVLIEAMGRLRNFPISASIAGSGTAAYEESLKQSARDLPVRFLGHSDPDDVLAKADVLVVPSQWREPMGLVVLEAWEHGIPVIASETGGLAELVRATGGGYLFPPGNAAQLASILRMLVQNGFPAAHWEMVCRDAEARFSLGRHVDRLLTIYDEAIARRPAAAQRHRGPAVLAPSRPALEP